MRESDTWLRHFLLHQHYQVADSLKMMDSTLAWRNSFGVNGKINMVQSVNGSINRLWSSQLMVRLIVYGPVS